MAGYCGYSKSNNAIEAERNNKFPASRLAKLLGVKTKALRAVLAPCEYHHTSKFFNATNYYDGTYLLMLLTPETISFENNLNTVWCLVRDEKGKIVGERNQDWFSDDLLEAIDQLKEMQDKSRRSPLVVANTP